MTSTKKQEATFTRVLGWAAFAPNFTGDVKKGMRALLGGVEGHPLLGTQSIVNTSMVLRIKREKKTKRVIEIETLNTIYRIKE